MVVKRRANSRLLIAATAIAIGGAVALTGCGTATGHGTGSGSAGSGSAGSPLAPHAKVVLTFTFNHVPGPTPRTWTLRCDPPGGSHPERAGAACAALLRMKDPFGPRPKRENCPMIMVSNETITVTGRWFGEKVNRVIIDGTCDLGLFNSVSKIIH